MDFNPIDIQIMKQSLNLISKFLIDLSEFPKCIQSFPIEENQKLLPKIGYDILIIHNIDSILDCAMGDIVNSLHIADSTANYRVDQLVKLGLVERHTPRQDKRKRCLKLTKLGRNMNGLFSDYMMHTFESTLTKFDLTQKNLILQFLQGII
jgi:DNA-binding MarR family transcriptional regulator